jgi:hemerythrin
MDTDTKWKPDLKVGSNIIDNQHKVMFDLVKDLNRSIRAGANKQVLDTLLDVVRNYAFKHFELEELYFKDHPDATRHCLEHYRLIKELNMFIVGFKNSRGELGKDPSVFLENWMEKHIEDYDKPFLAHETAKLSLQMEKTGQVDEYDHKGKERRRYRRIRYKDVVDGEIRVLCYNATRLKNGAAAVLDMGTGGLLLHSNDVFDIDDLLVISCSIGRTFKMKEKVRVKWADKSACGVEFVAPSRETIEFFTKLYGAVHLNRKVRPD